VDSSLQGNARLSDSITIDEVPMTFFRSKAAPKGWNRNDGQLREE
jgi:hypothetical protein